MLETLERKLEVECSCRAPKIPGTEHYTNLTVYKNMSYSLNS